MAARRPSAPKFSKAKSAALRKSVAAENAKGGSAKMAERARQSRASASRQARDARGRFK